MPNRTLSSKAMGKRPMHGINALKPSARIGTPPEHLEDMDEWASASGSASASSRRVQPARARRGMAAGSQLGTNDVDRRLLDMLRRKGESEPLIPAHTNFILTTDASLIPSSSTNSYDLNKLAEELYFERPEVMEAIRTQQRVQVPEFKELTEGDRVTGRLRTRNEAEPYELSDAAYEKRHRKHELSEKKQRMREKEQLRFEHYKLKERIDQLRNMDSGPFLSLPTDAFASPEEDGVMEHHVSAAIALGLGMNSAAAHQEGERRQQLFLKVATSLEERYRTLLPPKFVEPRATSCESSEADVDEEEDEHVGDEEEEEERSQSEREDADAMDEDEISDAPLSPPSAPPKRKPAKAPDISLATSRRRRTATPASEETGAGLPREGIFERDPVSANVVVRQKAASAQPPDQRPSPIPTNATLPKISYITTSRSFPSISIQSSVQRPSLNSLFPHLRTTEEGQLTNSDQLNMDESSFRNMDHHTAQVFFATLRGVLDKHNRAQSLPEAMRALTSTDGHPSEATSLQLAQADQTSTASEDEQLPFSPVPEIPETKHSPSALSRHSEYDFEQARRFRIKDTTVRSESIVADSLASRSSVPRTTESVYDGYGYNYERRQTSPVTASSSMPPHEHDASSTASGYFDKSLSEFIEQERTGRVVSLASYDIILAGRGRPRKEFAEIVRASRHNDEPGKRTGRLSTKAFGYDPPLGESGPEAEFELPAWILQTVALLRADEGGRNDRGPLLNKYNVKNLVHSSFEREDSSWQDSSTSAIETRQSHRLRAL